MSLTPTATEESYWNGYHTGKNHGWKSSLTQLIKWIENDPTIETIPVITIREKLMTMREEEQR